MDARYKKIVLSLWQTLVFLLLGCTLALSQPVTVTSLSPSASPVGSTVVITGTNFGATAANNVVYFGAVRGTITIANGTSISVTVPAGATPGPLTVINTTTGLQGTSPTTFQVTFSGGVVNQCAFNNDIVDFNSTGFTGGTSTYTAADINTDGKPELLFVTFDYNFVTLVRNNSVPGSLTSASFGDTTRLMIGPGSEEAMSIATADLDGDGWIDVVVGEGGSSPGIGVFRNTSSVSTISFAPKQQFTGVGNAIVIADLDFDGKPEVISGSNVYRNTSTQGNISFTLVTVAALSSGVTAVIFGDLDGDHKPDAVYLNSGYLYVTRNVGTTAPVTSSFFSAGVNIGVAPLASLAITDLDGDGKSEVITMDNLIGHDTIYVYRNIATSGTLNASSFAPRISLTLGYDPTGTGGTSTQVTTGDVDGDGKQDIIALDRTFTTNPQAYAIGVLTNKTTPGVITAASFGKEFYETGTYNGNMVLPADIDVDGRLDLVYSRNNVSGNSYIMSVLRNTMTESSCSLTVASPAPVISSFAPATGNVGTSVVIAGTNFNSSLSNMAVYFGGIKANITAGSATSLTVTVPTGINRERLIVLDLQTHLQAMSMSHFSATFGTTHTLDATSFNGNQQFQIATTDLSGAEINYTGLADYDHDGRYDIIHQYEFFNNLHISKNLSTPSTYSFPADGLMRKTSFYGYAIPSADLDGDGKTDMIASSYYSLNIWKNNYAGGLLDSTSFSEYQNRMGGSLNDLVYPGAPADMDGDGRPDIVLTGAKGTDAVGTFSILRNISANGSLTFTSKIIFPQTVGVQVGLGDFNGDNKFDIVVPDGTSSNTILVYQNNSTIGNISPATFTKTTILLGGPLYFYYSADVVDIDGDGKQDIVMGHNHGATIIRNIYSGGPITAASFAAPFEIANLSLVNDPTLKIADLDGDGKPDIVTSYIDKFYIYKNTSTAGTIDASSFAAPLMVATNALKIEVADINGDGRPELLGFAGGSVIIHYPAAAVPPNQPPVLSTTTTTDAYTGAALVVDNQISVSDGNDTNLAGATMTIDNVLPEDLLVFTNQNGITGVYDSGDGTMTLTGSSTVANYQTAVRSIQYNNSAGAPTPTTRSVEVFATDGKAQSNTVNYSITFGPSNQPPVLTTITTSDLYSGTPLIVDGQISVSDANDSNLAGATMAIENVFDEDLLVFTNQNGISGNYNSGEGTMILSGSASVAKYQTALRSIRYQNTATKPDKTIRVVELFVTDGKAPSDTVTYSITFPTAAPPGNKPPVIAVPVVSTVVKGAAVVNLVPLISDPDGNLELNTLTIVSQPESGATATISAGDSLKVDYSGVDFTGIDHLTIQVCDSSAVCAQQVIQIDVLGDLVIYNGISANGDQFNPVFKIENIEVLKDTQNNHVSIYNRWGDIVYEVDNYDNTLRVFKGVNKNGGDLPAGTYFYKIEFTGGRASLTGYLSLKR